MSLPAFNEQGDLPTGIYPATLSEVLLRLGNGLPNRRLAGLRLERVYRLVSRTGHLARFVIFGSVATAKPDPNDVDVFLLMEHTFHVGQLSGEVRLIFDHATAQSHFGCSIFWLRRLAAFEGEEDTLAYWQIKRDGKQRGIVEIIPESK